MSKRVLISGGGTGGHIYPAISIANEIKRRYPDTKFLFVGASDRMEMEKVPQAGYAIKGLWIAGLQRKLTLQNLLFPVKLLFSLWKSRAIVRKFKPDVVVGTGGFASGPVLHVASSKGVPALIQEQNSFPGITNKLLAKKVNAICVAYEGLERFFSKSKIEITGNPVRQDILSVEDKKREAMSFFGLDKRKKTVLILGGSLGARVVNQTIAENLEAILREEVQVIWQTGKFYIEDYKKYDKEEYVQTHAYLSDMNLAYAAADVIISRAGASSISELCLVGKPVVFIPSPNVAEDHQTKNAKAIVDKQGALLLKEKDREQFMEVFSGLVQDEQKMKLLSQNIKALGKPDATKDIVNKIEKIARWI